MNNIKFLTIITSIVVTHTASALTIFTDRVAWELAVSGDTVLEDFNESASLFPPVIIDGSVVSLPSGLILTGSGSGALAINRPGNNIDFNSENIETDFEDPSRQIIFSFTSPFLAIGFDYARADFIDSIWLTGIDGIALSPPPNQGTGSISFFGVIADSPFEYFALSTNANDQEYRIDNIRFYPVPVPAALWLFVSSLLSISFVCRSRVSR